MNESLINNVIKSATSQVGYLKVRLGRTPDRIRLRSDIYREMVEVSKMVIGIAGDRLAGVPVIEDKELETEYSIEIMGTLLE